MIPSLGEACKQRGATARGFLLFVSLVALMAGNAGARQQLSPEARDHLDRARAAMARNQYEEAIGEFRRALKADSACVECRFKLAQAYQKLGAHKDAIEAAKKALEVAPDDHWRAIAHNIIGVEISALIGNGKIHHDEAEREFRIALQLDPNDVVTYFNLGAELMREVRDAEGISVLREYLQRAPNAADAKLARALMENPRRARESFAPADFALVTKDGEYVTLEEVKGRVVLLDFWASWCKPCEAALPTLQRLSRRYARDQFTLVSISVDQNEQAWQSFMASHRMDWPQALDRDYKLRQMFNVRSYPTYILIDTEGIMRSYVIGSGFESVAQLDDAVAKLVKTVRKAEKTMVASNAPPTAVPVPVRPAPSSASAPDSRPPSSAAVSDSRPPSSASAPDSRPAASNSTAPVASTVPTVAETLPAAASAPAGTASANASSGRVPTAASGGAATNSPARQNDGPESLLVTSNPDGAEIYVDQNFFGNAPATLKLSTGRHFLRLTLAGYHTWAREVTAQPGSEARLTANLMKNNPATIQGRVLWNEQPVAGVQVYAAECGPSSPKAGPATTDSQGRYTIADVPDARVCLELHSPSPAFRFGSAGYFDVAPGKETTAPDAYLCQQFDGLSPKPEEWVKDSRPILKWNPYPDAVGYSVQVWHLAPNYVNNFRRGDREPRIDTTTIQTDVDLNNGEYYWRVDAYNRAGHIIGCGNAIKFSVAARAPAASK